MLKLLEFYVACDHKYPSMQDQSTFGSEPGIPRL